MALLERTTPEEEVFSETETEQGVSILSRAGTESRLFRKNISLKDEEEKEEEKNLSIFDENRREKAIKPALTIKEPVSRQKEVSFLEKDRPEISIQEPVSRSFDPDENMLSLSSGAHNVDELREESDAVAEEQKSFGDKTRGVVNFLFGDEMGVMGMKWDKQGFTWAIDNMIDQWSEHPVLSTFATVGLVAQVAFPAYGALSKSTKVGKLAKAGHKASLLRTAQKGGKFNLADEIKATAKSNSFLLDDADAIAIKTKAAAAVDKGTYARREFLNIGRGDAFDNIDPVLAGTKVVDEAVDVQHDIYRYFDPDTAKEILSGKLSDEEIISKYGKLWKQVTLSENRMNDWLILEHKARFGEDSIYGPMSKAERAYYKIRKAFGNDYFKQLYTPASANIAGWDKFFIRSGLPEILQHAPDEKFGKDVVQFLINKKSIADLRSAGMDDAGIKWAQNLGDRMTKLQRKMFDDGFLSTEEFDKFAEFAHRHVTAIKKGTPAAREILGGPGRALPTKAKIATLTKTGKTVQEGAAEGIGKTIRSSYATEAEDKFRALLNPATLQSRDVYTTAQKYIDDIDQMITDPADFTMATLVRDSQLFHGYNFFRDALMNPEKFPHMVRNTIPEGSVAKNWIKLNDFDKIGVKGAANRILRMINTQRAKTGLPSVTADDLPYMSKEVVDQFYSHDGFIGQISANHNLLEIITAVHKTARTALNPGTHVQNLGGNLFGFLPMAGYNILNPFKARERIRDGSVISKVFSKMAKVKSDNAKAIAKAIREGSEDVPARFAGSDLFKKEFLNKQFVDVINEIKDKGDYFIDEGEAWLRTATGKINLSDFFSSKAVMNTLEESAFDNIEGFGRVQKVLADFGNVTRKPEWQEKPANWLTHQVAKSFGKLTGFGTGGRVEAGLHKMSSAYLAEDAVPKMMYALDLRRRGMSPDQVVLEVGRRLPQYQAVGSMLGSARKWVLPWITFPAEATRIIKNNLIDYPLRMLPWMQAPAITQGIFQGLGFGPTPEQFEGGEGLPSLAEQLPQWAHKYSTTVAKEGPIGTITGGFTGGVLGAVAGARFGGPKAGLVGGALGALAGAMVGEYGAAIEHEQDEDNIRAWVMDFLPTSAALWNPATTSPYAKPKELLPVEPFAVVMPLIRIGMGQGDFGQDVPNTGRLDMMSKMAMGTIGFISPPWMQKYGMKVTGTGGLYLPMTDVMDDLGGTGSVDSSQEVYFDDRAGVTVQETTKPVQIATSTLTGAALGAAAGGVPGAAVGAGLGLVASKGLNNRRLMEDLGIMGNSYTNRPGNPVFDMVFNTFAGLPKTWEPSPAQALINEKFRQQPFQKLRTNYRRNLEDAIQSDNQKMVRYYLEQVQKTFSTEYLDPNQAQVKYHEWIKRNIKTIGRVRGLDGISEDQLLMQLESAHRFALKSRTQAAQTMVKFLQEELLSRRVNQQKQATTRSSLRREKDLRILSKEPKSFTIKTSGILGR